MLDNRTDVLLNYINKQCSEGSYRIFSPSELISAFPEKFAVDFDGLLLILDYLKEREYIAVKYTDEKAVCLAPMPKGRIYHEEQAAAERHSKSYKRLVCFALIGSLLGGVIGRFLTELVFLLLGA